MRDNCPCCGFAGMAPWRAAECCSARLCVLCGWIEENGKDKRMALIYIEVFISTCPHCNSADEYTYLGIVECTNCKRFYLTNPRCVVYLNRDEHGCLS